MAATHVVTGIPLPPGGGPTPTRKEVTAWIALAKSDRLYAYQVALYFKAMIVFQKMDPANELSYYRITGMSLLQHNCRPFLIILQIRHPWRPRYLLGRSPQSPKSN